MSKLENLNLMKCKNTTGHDCYEVEDGENVSYCSTSSTLKNSQMVYLSENVADSGFVVSSENVFKSDHVYMGDQIIRSHNIRNGHNISDSRSILYSDKIIQSKCIAYSSNLTDCHFCYRDTHLKHCMFCFALHDKEYCLFNQSVTREQYEECLDQLSLFEVDMELFYDWPLFEKPIIQKSLVELYKIKPSFYKWAKSLPNFDEITFFNCLLGANNYWKENYNE